MYNEVKINMLDNDCDCEYVLSEDGSAITPFVYIRMYIGEGLENIEIQAKSNNQENYWLLPEISGGYVDGWYLTRLSYSDFAKTGSENYEIQVQAFANGEQIGTKTLFFFHSGLQSSGNWVVTKQHGTIRDAYEVNQGSSSGGGGGGGGGGGTTYTAGNGITITDSDEIKAKIDNSTIQFDTNGNMYVPTVPLTLNNAIVIQEADAKYLLHEYTTVEYIAGNRICYAGAQNQIIAQGYIIYKNGGTAPNGVEIVYNITSENLSELPDIPMYTDMSFPEATYYTNGNIRIKRIYLALNRSDTNRDAYELRCVDTDGGELRLTTITNYDNFGYGFALIRNSIYPPGYSSGGITYPYGCVSCTYAYKVKSSPTGYQFYFQNATFFYIGFASEAEYNAAVGLTYEPQTLANVEETITEV